MYRSVLSLLSLAALVGVALTDCSTELSVEQFQQLYCDSSLVFRGSKTFSSSSLSMDQNRQMVVYGYSVFQADQVYKGSPSNPNDIEVERVWKQAEDTCDSAAFPDEGSTFLVFASGTAEYMVEPCRHSFPWDECVPESFKESLPYTNCP